MGVTGLLIKAFSQGGFNKPTARGTTAGVSGGKGRTIGDQPVSPGRGKGGKGGKLALIKTTRTGILEKQVGTSGRGKLLGN